MHISKALNDQDDSLNLLHDFCRLIDSLECFIQ